MTQDRRAELLEKIDAAFAGGLRSNETMVAHAVLDIALKAAAEIADDHTPGKRGATLVAHVTGQNIKRAILALTSEGTKQ